MGKIIGSTTMTPMKRSDWNQDDPTKAGFIPNKPILGAIASKDEVAKTDLSDAVQASLNKADTAIQSIDGLATETYVDNKVASMVDSAPETLNTLNELAAALGDDPNFATTIATQIGNKADAEHDHGDTYAYKNEATTHVTDDGNGNVVLTNVAVDTDAFTETDPTVPEWAKEPEKPNYTWNEITDKPFTDGKLNPECLPDDIGGGSENAVEYVEQTLTEEQKARARANIGAAASYTYGTTDLTNGVSELAPGMLYFVY